MGAGESLYVEDGYGTDEQGDAHFRGPTTGKWLRSVNDVEKWHQKVNGAKTSLVQGADAEDGVVFSNNLDAINGLFEFEPDAN